MKSECDKQNDDGLGLNRLGDAILCLAWGETDRPYALLAKTASDVLHFIVTQWIDDESDPLVKEIMAELATHDWSEGCELKYDFEIGGMSFMDVCSSPPSPLRPTPSPDL